MSKPVSSRIPTCPVCSKRFRLVMSRQIPKLLPCGHTVCDGCVESIGYGGFDGPRCPCCQEGGLPPDRSSLPINEVVALHSERCIAAVDDASSARLLCEGCKADGLDASFSTHRCDNCDKPMCLEHSRIHERRGHRVKKDDAIPGLHPTTECSRHHGQSIFFYCFTCGVPACQTCTVLDHPPASHDVKDVNSSADILAKRLDNGVKRFAKGVQDIEVAGVTVLDATDVENRVKDASIAAIDEALETVVSAVHMKFSALKRAVLNRHDTNTRLLQGQVDALKQRYNQLQLMIDIGTQTALGRNPVEISHAMEVMASTAKLIQPYPGLPFDASQSLVTTFDLTALLAAVDALPGATGVTLSHDGKGGDSTSSSTSYAYTAAMLQSTPDDNNSGGSDAVHTSTTPVPVDATPTKLTRSGSDDGNSNTRVGTGTPVESTQNRPRLPSHSVQTSHATGQTVSALQSQLASKLGGGGYAPFGAVPVMMVRSQSQQPPQPPQHQQQQQARPPATDLDSERILTSPATPSGGGSGGGSSASGGIAIIHTAQLKQLFKLSRTSNAWEPVTASTPIGCVILGKGSSYKVLIYDSAQKHICVGNLAPDVAFVLQRPDTLQLTFRTATPDGQSQPSVDCGPGTWCLVCKDADTATALVQSLMLTQLHCSLHGYGPEGMARMRLLSVLSLSPNPSAHKLEEGDAAGCFVSMWPVTTNPNDAPLGITTTSPLFTNVGGKKLTRCVVTSGVTGSLGDSLKDMTVGTRLLVLLPSSRALDAVGMTGLADEGTWMLCDIKVEKSKAKDDGSVPRGSVAVSELLDVD